MRGRKRFFGRAAGASIFFGHRFRFIHTLRVIVRHPGAEFN